MKGPEAKKEYVSPELTTHGSVEELTGQKASLTGSLGPPRGTGSGSPDAPFGS